MILVDTSVWIDHLRKGSARLQMMLEKGAVLGHPLVTAELACGNIRNRLDVLGLLDDLPQAADGEIFEMRLFLEAHALHGNGLGYVDVAILMSAQLTGCQVWTLDKALQTACSRLGVQAV